jgi:ribonuclease-3
MSISAHVDFRRKKELKKILKKVQISFKDFNLLNVALSHRSYVNEHNLKENNEKLEFLGDSILGFIITEFLFKTYFYLTEGDLAKIKSAAISENTLYKIAKGINFNNYILIGKGEESCGGRNKKTIIADAFEAFLASYYIDSNLNKVKNLITRLFKKEIQLIVENKHEERDFKSLLQELAQKRYKSCPVYHLKSKEGPEHNRTFYMEVLISGQVFGVGEGKSKKDAEQLAAKNAYNKITSLLLVESNPFKKQ